MNEKKVLEKLEVIRKLMVAWFSQMDDIELRTRIQTLSSIGLSNEDISSILNKPIAIVNIMVNKKGAA